VSRPRTALALLLCLALAQSCEFDLLSAFGRADNPSSRLAEGSSRVQPSLSLAEGSPFSFVVTSDLHFNATEAGPRDEALAGFAALASGGGVALALFCGDLTDKGLESEYQAFAAFADSLRDSGGTAPLPWYAAVGNHDLYNSGWPYFKEYVGPSHQRIDAGPVSIYIVDSGGGTMGDRQLENLRDDMGSDPKPKIVVGHYPVRGHDSYIYYRITNPRERIELLDLFARSDVRLVLAGHRHAPVSTELGAFYELVVGSLVDSDGVAYALRVDVAGDGSIAGVTRTEL
jgi:Icc protein